ncbi:hypothetical protein KHQ82_06165 [Mycoplasmatota bacterium]|nr:hypothetical protein KHQ82_06165 [Mycoplasmatota bacterium]
MKKFLLAFMVTAVVVLALPTVEAKIGEVLTTEEREDYKEAKEISKEANLEIKNLVIEAKELAEEYPEYTEDIIQNLVVVTNEIAYSAIEAIKELGFVAVCEYKTYIIGGQEVEIDPLRVYGW